ncbi:hypothetical protein COU77_03320, partial [Candidatus Peregrinibacteria bacterium CG10_big_fil_rev_8_21_14_0_10_49_16]
MRFLLKILTFGLLPFLTLVIGVNVGVRFSQELLYGTPSLEQQFGTGAVVTNPEEEVDLAIMWEVWNLLLKRYISPEELKTTPMVYGAITGLVEAIGDPHTLFMTPQQNKEFRDALQGELQGIGAELMVQGGKITVVAPLKGSPAERASLLPNDIIVAVDGESVEGLSLYETVHRIRG